MRIDYSTLKKVAKEFEEELLESLKKLRNEIKFKKVKAN